jgi:quercetin dioxygenase-like cupin family protein
LKLADVSEATGISASFLSLIESGKNDVTISRLARLCAFYGIEVADVLPPLPTTAAGVRRRGEHQHFFSPAEGMDLSVLGRGSVMSLFRVDFEPEAHTTEQISSGREGILVVTEGRVEVSLDDQDPIPLEQGDTLYVSEGRRRGYRNPDPERPATMLVVGARRRNNGSLG